ncbi:MAG: UDP-N-acetylglucosamine 2-epimerase (non-hydrolyzing) [Actinomycetota bacterium]|nr:UDP-N-acetylglucosamine 2-epimerase (non-hydrolyzing) [Actinomycetota bacterium]
MKIVVVFGTRPEIVKLSLFVKYAYKHPDIELSIVHTGQHYNHDLSEQFLKDLGLPSISINLEVGSLERADQIQKICESLKLLLTDSRPDFIVVQGDTNSTLASALAGSEEGVPVVHIEAGLRCFDNTMVEEINRKETDRLSSICFAPTRVSAENLLREGIPEERIRTVGNTIVEVVFENLKIAQGKSKIVELLGLRPKGYLVITAHRQENVDDRQRLKDLVSAFEQIELPMVYPVHPRTMERFVEYGLLSRLESIANLRLIDPLPYWDFLRLSQSSRIIITDSGGIQEECSIYKKPVVIARENTERPEILGTFGVLAGRTERILSAVKQLDENYDKVTEKLSSTPCPFGDMKASERILEELVGRI